MSVLTAEEAVHRAQRAQAILGDPLITETLQAIEAQYLAHWRKSDSTTEERERCWSMIQHVDLFRSAFETYIRSGKVAAREIAEAEARKKVNASEP